MTGPTAGPGAAHAARTYLFVPGNRPDRFDKALACGADAVVLDLEDAVAPADKEAARDSVGGWLRAADAALRSRVVVRINDDTSPWFKADLAMLRDADTAEASPSLMLPKAERVDTVVRVHAICPDIAVLALIETARGVLQAEALAQMSGVRRLVFGTIDYALDLDLSGAPEGFIYAASRLALASRAAGLPPPVAGVTAELDDEARLLADLAQARAQGFGAKLCIHPRQVAPIHRALAPSEAEVAWAQRVIQAASDHPGAVQLDGRMVDKPVLERARALLARRAA